MSLIRTLVIEFPSHLDNPEWSHLKIFRWITSAMTQFPNKGIFTGSRMLGHRHIFLKTTIQPTTENIIQLLFIEHGFVSINRWDRLKENTVLDYIFL